MFLELMLPQSRFARFPLGLRKLMHRYYVITTSLKPCSTRLSRLGQTEAPHHLATSQSPYTSRCRISFLVSVCAAICLYKDGLPRNLSRASSITGSQLSNYSNHYFSSILLNTSSLYYLISSLTGSDNNQQNQHVRQDLHHLHQPFGFLFPRGWPRCYHQGCR